MARPTSGIHHITGICGAAQENLSFYNGLLGLRLVKKSVNFDDPSTYHLYYGDSTGQPGTVLTFFPWENAHPGKLGGGQITAIVFSIREGSLDYWTERFADLAVDFDLPPPRFERRVLVLRDPDGLQIELEEGPVSDSFRPWSDSGISEGHAIRGFRGSTLEVVDIELSSNILVQLGLSEIGEAEGRLRFQMGQKNPGNTIDLKRAKRAGRLGRGVIHHIAFRADDATHQLEMREHFLRLGLEVTPVVDRRYFRSIYFREPGGVLYEIATDGPGFLTDESAQSLGTTLMLPPWLEGRRSSIETRLPELRNPRPFEHPTPDHENREF